MNITHGTLFVNQRTKNSMTAAISLLTNDEIEEKINELETTFAELLGDGCSTYTLKEIWGEIQELQLEMKHRSNLN